MCQKHCPNKWNFIIKNSTIMVTEFHQSFIFALIFQIREIAIIFVKTITFFIPITSLVPVFKFLITTISIIKSIYETVKHWITVSISNSAVKRQKFREINFKTKSRNIFQVRVICVILCTQCGNFMIFKSPRF